MTVRRRLLPAVLCLLAGYSLTAAAYNTSSSCTGTGNTTFSLPNLTFNTNQLPAVGAVLYTSPAYPVSYKCTTELDSQATFAPMLQRLGDFDKVVEALESAGLGLDIILQEAGQPEVTWSWYDMTKNRYKIFGATMPSNATDIFRSATFRLRLFVRKPITSAKIVQFSALSAFSIIPSLFNYSRGVLLTSTPFSIRYMPDNFGYVSLSTTTVNLGHIYTNYQNPAKRARFEVTAGQRMGVGGPEGDFTIPLQTTFTATGKTLTDNGQAARMTTEDGQANGLKLSILDTSSGDKLTFGQPSDLGKLKSGGTGILATPVSKDYTALLEQDAGTPLRTGPFSANVVVTVTYN
ncbi:MULTISPECIES: hypothetical protein [Klebsiella]|jgi:hypothetical protein|uniref:Fimbrial protein n=1 Tax=Klebsiella pneumoniae TaxID=573 RepID=A0AAX2BUD7_KLEPN|nr:hypothetical protein [Klebsiella pneumoniae]HDS3989901.1 hypothetical protein [Klebsiella pneumoniae subsp. ozaenae]EKW1758792.1 hypothetical protein [Klebsiella pneumoniae]KMD75032.1 hypothetical protein SL84_04660 [Klebsiella pneumoniae]MBD7731715.1 hypothetical protein [Klebsiella pneumoniae]MBK4909733.1 fimbrial protein [Klebsiella pneumoniae]